LTVQTPLVTPAGVTRGKIGWAPDWRPTCQLSLFVRNFPPDQPAQVEFVAGSKQPNRPPLAASAGVAAADA